MQKKKESSLKGLISILLLLVVLSIYIIAKLTEDNMTVEVTVYNKSKPVPNAVVLIGKEKGITMDNGTAQIQLRVSEGEKLFITAQYKNKKQYDTIYIDKDRYLTTHTNSDIVFNEE
jgi:hypothetical protein